MSQFILHNSSLSIEEAARLGCLTEDHMAELLTVYEQQTKLASVRDGLGEMLIPLESLDNAIAKLESLPQVVMERLPILTTVLTELYTMQGYIEYTNELVRAELAALTQGDAGG